MKILLAEDEKDLSRALVAILKMQKFDVDAVYNGKDAVELSSKNSYDAMIFDIMMPIMDGVTALKTIRQSGNFTPALLLTAKSEINDKLTGFDAGADDYLTKPFLMQELVARVRSMTRRTNEYTPKTITIGSVTLNTQEQEIKSENSIRLAGKETKLMEFFMLNPEKEIEEKYIFDKIWGDEKDADQKIVYMYVSYLNGKLQSINADIKITKCGDGKFILKSAR